MWKRARRKPADIDRVEVRRSRENAVAQRHRPRSVRTRVFADVVSEAARAPFSISSPPMILAGPLTRLCAADSPARSARAAC